MEWIDIGLASEYKSSVLKKVALGNEQIAVTFSDEKFGAVSSRCVHYGADLSGGKILGDFVECPWHYWQYNRFTGEANTPAPTGIRIPAYEIKVDGDRLLLKKEALNSLVHPPHTPPHLARTPVREPGPIRILGISTTVMDVNHPRYSTSEDLLTSALDHGNSTLAAETKVLKVRELNFRPCEGFYSKSARACTWPCSITMMDPDDQMDRVYEAVVHWADVIIVSTPIRWGAPSSLYYKMVERMNCIQNQITLKNKQLLKNKVIGLIVTGGQDNVQAVAGQMLMFFGELGCASPPFPFVGHSRGWDAEDMENNIKSVKDGTALRGQTTELLERCHQLANQLLQLSK